MMVKCRNRVDPVNIDVSVAQCAQHDVKDYRICRTDRVPERQRCRFEMPEL